MTRQRWIEFGVMIALCLVIGWVVGTWRDSVGLTDRVLVPTSYLIEHEQCQVDLARERAEHIESLGKLAGCREAVEECVGMVNFYRDAAVASNTDLIGVSKP